MKRLSPTVVQDPAFKALKRLTSPRKVQDFLDRIPINMEPDGETCSSALYHTAAKHGALSRGRASSPRSRCGCRASGR